MDTIHAMPKRDLLKCKQCGWRWLQVNNKPPRRCPNDDCRSMRWNRKARPVKLRREVKALA